MATCVASPGPQTLARREASSTAPGVRRRLTLARPLGALQAALGGADERCCGSVALRRATARVRANVATLFARLPDCARGAACVYGDRRWRVRVNGRQLYLQQAMAVLCDDTLADVDVPFRVVSHCAPPARCAPARLVPDNCGTPLPTAPTDMVCINPAHFAYVQFEAPRKRKRGALETGRVTLNSDSGPVECALSERMRFEHFYMQAPIAGRRRRAATRRWVPAPRPARDRGASHKLRRPHYTACEAHE